MGRRKKSTNENTPKKQKQGKSESSAAAAAVVVEDDGDTSGDAVLKKVIVVDMGSKVTKIGFTTQAAPHKLPTVVACRRSTPEERKMKQDSMGDITREVVMGGTEQGNQGSSSMSIEVTGEEKKQTNGNEEVKASRVTSRKRKLQISASEISAFEDNDSCLGADWSTDAVEEKGVALKNDAEALWESESEEALVAQEKTFSTLLKPMTKKRNKQNMKGPKTGFWQDMDVCICFVSLVVKGKTTSGWSGSADIIWHFPPHLFFFFFCIF